MSVLNLFFADPIKKTKYNFCVSFDQNVVNGLRLLATLEDVLAGMQKLSDKPNYFVFFLQVGAVGSQQFGK